jgi:hypothetical protein
MLVGRFLHAHMTEILRHALRRVWQTRLLSAAAIVCVGLGAAATATVATPVSAALVRPVPFQVADRLVRIWFEEPGVNPRISFSIPELTDFQSMGSFDALLGTVRVRTSLRLGAGAERIRGEGRSRRSFSWLPEARSVCWPARGCSTHSWRSRRLSGSRSRATFVSHRTV